MLTKELQQTEVHAAHDEDETKRDASSSNLGVTPPARIPRIPETWLRLPESPPKRRVGRWLFGDSPEVVPCKSAGRLALPKPCGRTTSGVPVFTVPDSSEDESCGSL